MFLPFPVLFKLSIISLYVLSLAFFCFFLTAYNDRFVGKVKVLERTIYRVMLSFQGFDMKMSFINFLTLNNEHKRMSFTFLRQFDYSTMALTEVSIFLGRTQCLSFFNHFNNSGLLFAFQYLMHSLSIIFLIYQFLWL